MADPDRRAAFEEHLRTSYPSRGVLNALESLFEVLQMVSSFGRPKAWTVGDILISWSEDLLAALIAGYAATVWLRRSLEAVTAFVVSERERSKDALGT